MVLKCHVRSALLYGCETCPLSTVMDKLESAEMWFYRRVLRISWKERSTNAEVLRRVESGTLMFNEIVKG